MRIAYIVYITNQTKLQTWNDGFKKAMDMLGGVMINLADNPSIDYLNAFDHLLFKTNWHWIVDNYYLKYRHRLDAKTSIMISGSLPPRNLNDYDLIFYETHWYYQNYLESHTEFTKKIFHAFGINTDIIHNRDIPKPFDWISVGAISEIKGVLTLADAMPGKGLIVGEIKDQKLYEKLLSFEHLVVKDYVDYETLNTLYNSSVSAVSNCSLQGGGERFILEAMACELNIVNFNHNPKLQSVIDGGLLDHHYYYQQLAKAIHGL